MKRFLLIQLMIICTSVLAFATKHDVTNNGTTFSPDSISITVGDTVVFTLSMMHDAIEVSADTYKANGKTSNGGFNVPYGGGSVVFSTTGTVYYVCEPHAALGMKGRIFVHGKTTGISELLNTKVSLSVYPNPATDHFRLTYQLASPSDVNIKIMDISGKVISTIKPGKQTEGWHEEIVAIDDSRDKGIYLLQLKINDKIFYRKVSIN
jgi:plastocyanin